MTNFDTWLKGQSIEKSALSASQLIEAKERFKKEIIAQKGDTSKTVNKWK